MINYENIFVAPAMRPGQEKMMRFHKILAIPEMYYQIQIIIKVCKISKQAIFIDNKLIIMNFIFCYYFIVLYNEIDRILFRNLLISNKYDIGYLMHVSESRFVDKIHFS